MRIILIISCGVVLASAACGGTARAGGRLHVVAAENVYGDIAARIGGSRVSVTSLLASPDADPHLFEPGTSSGLAVARARLVIQNGAGYDSFVDRLDHAAPSDSRVVVTIADVLHVSGHDANPHLWYDVPRLDSIAAAIADGLTRADPAGRAAYRAGARRFVAGCAALRAEVRSIRRRFRGAAVAYTEPVAGYLVAVAGLRNVSPASFTRAVQDGTEPTPIAVAQMTALVASRKVRVLLYNDQVVSPITARVRGTALAHHVPVVGVSELLPPHLRYEQWQLQQARSLAKALAR